MATNKNIIYSQFHKENNLGQKNKFKFLNPHKYKDSEYTFVFLAPNLFHGKITFFIL